VTHPGSAVVLPRRPVETIAAYDSGESSLPVPTATAVAFTSKMFVVWMAPRVIVHDGFQYVDSS
jgi:hypothetical protein